MGNRKIKYSERLDTAGAVLSWACFIHCVALPFVVALMPLSAASVLVDEKTEWAILAATLVIGSFALVPSYFRRHRNLNPLVLFAAGFALIIAAEPFFEESLGGRAVLLVFGAIGVTAAHLLNRRMCKKCTSCVRF